MHPSLLRRDQAVLVLVDVQERLHAEMPRRDEVGARLLKLAEAARILQVPVIVTEHAARAFGPTIEPVRAALQSVAAVPKMVFSCFGSEEFRSKLESLGRKQVVLAGYETHVCVCQTALDARAAGYQVHLARDASASRADVDYGVGVEKMAGAGVLPATAETVIFELLEKAGTDEFRALLPILKRK
ncbi:MAG TPA: isochorismatase family protein [Planctomycetota bacterium]|nr:isochorismatase family protein [Planctomycetota bacterium]